MDNLNTIKIDEEIELKKMSPLHAQELYDLICINRDHLKEWLPWLDTVKAVDDTRDFLNMMSKKDISVHGPQMSIWFNQKIVGVIAFHTFDFQNKSSSLGYWLDKNSSGHGIMTKACKELIKYALLTCNLNSVIIEAATENHRSRGIPERLGFRLDGVIRDREWLYDHFVDHAVYSLLKRECSFLDKK